MHSPPHCDLFCCIILERKKLEKKCNLMYMYIRTVQYVVCSHTRVHKNSNRRHSCAKARGRARTCHIARVSHRGGAGPAHAGFRPAGVSIVRASSTLYAHIPPGTLSGACVLACACFNLQGCWRAASVLRTALWQPTQAAATRALVEVRPWDRLVSP